MKEIIEQFNELEDKIIDAKAKINAKKQSDQDDIKRKIAQTKGDIDAYKENMRLWSENKNNRGFIDLLQAKTIIEKKEKEIRLKLDNKKYESKRQYELSKLNYALKNATFQIEMAKISINKALLETLEYLTLELEYEKKHHE